LTFRQHQTEQPFHLSPKETFKNPLKIDFPSIEKGIISILENFLAKRKLIFLLVQMDLSELETIKEIV
jgi:hypothetical protein